MKGGREGDRATLAPGVSLEVSREGTVLAGVAMPPWGDAHSPQPCSALPWETSPPLPWGLWGPYRLSPPCTPLGNSPGALVAPAWLLLACMQRPQGLILGRGRGCCPRPSRCIFSPFLIRFP